MEQENIFDHGISTQHIIIKPFADNIQRRSDGEKLSEDFSDFFLEQLARCIDMVEGNKKILEVPKYLKEFKKDITIDTREDLFFMRRMFSELYKGYPIYFVRAYEWIKRR